MSANQSRRSPAELARLGTVIIKDRIEPTLGPEDDYKFVAVDVDVDSADFEVDADDYTAVMRLRGRRPDADMWLGRVGQPSAYQIRRSE